MFTIYYPERPCWEATCHFILFPPSFPNQLSTVVGLTSALFCNRHRLLSSPTPLLVAAPPSCPCSFILPTHIPPTFKFRSSPTLSVILPCPPAPGRLLHLHSQLRSLLKCTKWLVSCAIVSVLVCSYVSASF